MPLPARMEMQYPLKYLISSSEITRLAVKM